MAEEPGELKSVDKLDPVSTAAGAGTEQSLEKYADEDPRSGEGVLDLTTREAPEETEHIKAQIAPAAQPASTSVGQCTPRYTRLKPTRAMIKIASARK